MKVSLLFFVALVVTQISETQASVNLLTRHAWRKDAMKVIADQYFNESGSAVNVTGSKDFVEEMYADLNGGTTLHDVYFTRMSSIGSAGEKMYDFGPLMREEPSLEWNDVSLYYRTSGSVLDGRVVNLPLQAEFLYFAYRKDILDKHDLEAPATLEEMVELAIRFNGTDLNGDNETDFGLCQVFGKTKAVEAEGKLLFSLIAPFLQSKGTASGAMFDPNTFEPLVKNAAAMEAFDLLRRGFNRGSHLDFMQEKAWNVQSLFNQGRCLFIMTWGDHLLNPGSKSHIMTGVGRVAFAPPPGASQVWDRDTQEFAKCNEELCPFAIDGVNHAPFAANGGWGLSVNGNLQGKRLQDALDFVKFAFLPKNTIPPMPNKNWLLRPYRYSQLDPKLYLNDITRAFSQVPKNISGVIADGYINRTLSMFDDENLAKDPVINGNSEYYVAIAEEFRRLLSGEVTVGKMCTELSLKFNKITLSHGGQAKQLSLYRKSLGLPPLLDSDTVIQHVEKPFDWVLFIVALLGTVVGLTIVVAALAWIIVTYRKKRKLERAREVQDHKRLIEAESDVGQFNHPMVLIKLADFLALGSLTSYETLRNLGRLVFLDSWGEASEFKKKNYIVFLSHQWLGWGEPDPQNLHYTTMVNAINELMKDVSGLSGQGGERETYIWVDFVSIAQKHRPMQRMAIMSLPVYCTIADAFIVAAPDAKHAVSRKMCDLSTYNLRGWCRAEMLSKVCGSGLSMMFICTSSDGSLVPVVGDMLKTLDLRVFDGQFSCCSMKHEGMTKCDKEELVQPVLGLWSMILKHRHEKHMQVVLEHIQESKDRFFPPSFEFTSRRRTLSSRPMHMLAETETSEYIDTSETRELFGELTRKMEARILSDSSAIPHPCNDIEVAGWSWYMNAVTARKSQDLNHDVLRTAVAVETECRVCAYV